MDTLGVQLCLSHYRGRLGTLTLEIAPMLGAHQKKSPEIFSSDFFNWLRPTFPGGCPPSIISDAGLNFCVRNGNRCISYSIATILIWMDVPSKLHANLKLRFFFLPGKFWSSPRSISTHKLHALLHFHLEPINHVVFMGSYSLRMGNLILRVASCLDAFSTYPFRT